MAEAKDISESVRSVWMRELPSGSMTYDAIVVGSGAAGGVAAFRLCTLGLNVLLLEAGRVYGRKPPLVTQALSGTLGVLTGQRVERWLPPKLLNLGERAVRFAGRIRQPVQSKLYAWALAPDSLVDDIECPYTTDTSEPFHWFRSRQPGGRMVVPGHGRQYYRLGGMGDRPDADGLPRWPVTDGDMAPWYGLVERTLGLRGGAGGASAELAEIIEPSGAEREIIDRIIARYPDARPSMGTHAPPAPWIELAHLTGRLSGRAGAVVRRVRIGQTGRAEGVEWFDCETGRVASASAPIVFVCASTIETTRILMLSRRSGAEAVGLHAPALGQYLMDHAKISGGGFCRSLPDMSLQPDEPGRSIYAPCCGPSGTQLGLQVHVHPRSGDEVRVDIMSFAEILPDAANKVSLDESRVDAFGMPVPHIEFRFSDAQHALGTQQIGVVRQVCRDLQLSDVVCSPRLAAPGTALHEAGTARMGGDAATSVVDPNNECWDVKGLYVTDGACFPRVSLQNPTLAIMALTARAAEHAATSTRTTQRPEATAATPLSSSRPSASPVRDSVIRG